MNELPPAAAKTGFFAYPGSPALIGSTIKGAIAKIVSMDLTPWEELDIPGRFIAGEVLEAIESNDVLFADISTLNFNVTYEIGYAIGRGRRVIPVRNRAATQGSPSLQEVGIFDTLGYREYSNAEELAEIIWSSSAVRPIDIPQGVNTKVPVYVVETKLKTDWMTRVTSRVKKSRLFFRNFDPNEVARLSAHEAISQVAQSVGVLVTLIARVSGSANEAAIHNLRASFVAGLAGGMRKVRSLLQDADGDPVPLDYRDFVTICRHPKDIDDAVAEFAEDVVEALQEAEEEPSVKRPPKFLQRVNLGASSAENEIRFLEAYYLRTDAFRRTERGEVNLVVGRKGAGKSAVFFQLRDRERANKENVVLDLKPEGYKLIKFSEQILRFLEKGTRQHTVMAFWEYVLLLEICHKIVEQDKERHLRDPSLYEPYHQIATLYQDSDLSMEGDFSERMSKLIERIANEFNSKYGDEGDRRLSDPQVTALIFHHDVRKLSAAVTNYLRKKQKLWLLFDNLDKGWPTTGVKPEDLTIIRALLDACRKLEQEMQRVGVEAKTVIFLRNDVYELLVRETSDRGKEASVMLDWTDPDLLRELLRLRIVANADEIKESQSFNEIWKQIATSHINGEETSQFVIERSLMRPRFLLNLMNHCKGFAIDLNHEVIEADDFKKGLQAFSADLLTDLNFEIHDVFPDSSEILYAFIGAKAVLTREEVLTALRDYVRANTNYDRLLELLLWFGFLGIRDEQRDEVTYIHSANYNMSLLRGVEKRAQGKATYQINPAFWTGLLIEESA